MDILYIVGTGSKWNDNELRYSLRSIAKYGKNVGQVYIVGHKPDWVSSQVIHIDCVDHFERKHKNMMYKVIVATERCNMSNHFLLSSDDHFYIKETDFDNYPIYSKSDTIRGGSKNSYEKSMYWTGKFLREHGLPTYQTNPHCNTHFDVDIYKKNSELFAKGIQLEYGAEMNCLMGNLMIQAGAKPTPYRDIKVREFHSREELLEKLGDSHCFSIGDEAIRCGIGKYLEELFPEKCRYEI